MIVVAIFIHVILTINSCFGASDPEHPYLATLDFCSATILSERWLITAAHCFDDQNIKHGLVTIERESTRKQIKYDKIMIHPGYKWFQDRVPVNDVALIRLKEPIELDDKIKAIELTKDKIRFDGASAFVDKINSTNTIKFNLAAMSMEKCLSHFGFLLSLTIRPYLKYLETVNICTKAAKNSAGSVCLSNTGGPIVQNNLLHGVASYFYQYGDTDCERLYFFTNLFNYLGWIKSIVQ